MSRSAAQGPVVAEWASHAGGCALGTILPAIVEGPIPGAYCGPFVPPGGTATCTWTPIPNTVPTGLVMGFEGSGNWLIRLGDGEVPVFGPFLPGSWSVTSPTPCFAKVMAFPTNLLPHPAAMDAPLDPNLIRCV